jgi:hypothetical protein
MLARNTGTLERGSFAKSVILFATARLLPLFDGCCGGTGDRVNHFQSGRFIRFHSLPARAVLVLAWVVALAGCGSGSTEEGGSTNNRPPVANAGGDQNVAELSVVQLAGSGSDPDVGDTLTYAWRQTAGTTVTLNTPASAATSFTAPDVPAAAPVVLTFQLTVTDAAGLSSSDSVSVTVQEPAAIVTISGTLDYQFPPPMQACNGLNFVAVELRPIRRATVQLLDDTGLIVLDSTTSDDNGAYTLTANASTNVMLRVRAELKQGGNPSWDVEVRNNVVDPAEPNPPPPAQRPLFVMDSAVFDSGVTNQTRDLTATTGWGGASYTGARVAAPFAVLDSIYSGIALITAEDAGANFVPLDAFWSPDNGTTRGTGTQAERIDSGEIGTSFYSNNALYLLGQDGDDAEEFDDHVIVHEWGHYFEDNFSRSDSIGGSHGIGDLLDKRVAFGEGFATALSGMALDDPRYCDTLWAGGVLRGFQIDIESGNEGTRGWYNEMSVLKLVYDLWDTDNDAADNGSIGFGPIYDVMTGAQASTPAFTSIFSFATLLKQLGTGQNAFIDAQLTDHDINATNIDVFGSSETNDGPGAPADVMPLYTPLTLGVPTRICANAQFDSGASRTGNKLSEHRYLTMSLLTPTRITFSMTTDSPPSQPSNGFDCSADENDPENHQHSDPDFYVYRNGNFSWLGASCEPNSEITTTNGLLPAGDYVIDIAEFRHEDDESPANFPEQVCFDFTASP